MCTGLHRDSAVFVRRQVVLWEVRDSAQRLLVHKFMCDVVPVFQALACGSTVAAHVALREVRLITVKLMGGIARISYNLRQLLVHEPLTIGQRKCVGLDPGFDVVEYG